MKLNLGCGNVYKEGWLNVDFNKNLKADKYFNLEKFPYPFKDNSFDEILLDHVLEHLEDTIKVLEEIHRISKDNAIIRINVPHYSSFMAFGHLTHKRFFGAGSLDNFKPDSWEKYSEVNFHVKSELDWMRCRNLGKINRLVNKILNKNLFITERFIVGFINIDQIKFTLRVIK